MSTIRVVRGSGAGPTEMAAYDAALADAGVANYNLVAVSSVIPEGVEVEAVGTAPALGPVGGRLTVVQARATAAGPGRVSAALGWIRARDGGPGLFYEAAGETDGEDVRTRVETGLDAGRELREWEFDPGTRAVRVESTPAEPGTHAAAVVLAAYGEAEPLP